MAEPMDKDIAVALEHWREFNANPNRWATFEAIQFTHDRIVRVDWGYRLSANGIKKIAIATRNFRLYPDGTVKWYDAVHP